MRALLATLLLATACHHAKPTGVFHYKEQAEQGELGKKWRGRLIADGAGASTFAASLKLEVPTRGPLGIQGSFWGDLADRVSLSLYKAGKDAVVDTRKQDDRDAMITDPLDPGTYYVVVKLPRDAVGRAEFEVEILHVSDGDAAK